MEEAPNNRKDTAASPREKAILIKYCIQYLLCRERHLSKLLAVEQKHSAKLNELIDTTIEEYEKKLAAEKKYCAMLHDKVGELIAWFDSKIEEYKKVVLELQNDFREQIEEAKKLEEDVMRTKHNSQSSTPRDLAE